MLRYPPKPHSSPNSPLLADQLASNTCPFETPRFASHTRRSAYRPGKPHVFLSTKQPLHPLIHGPGRHSASSQYGVGFDWFHKINASPPLHIVANAPWHPAFPPHLLLSDLDKDYGSVMSAERSSNASFWEQRRRQLRISSGLGVKTLSFRPTVAASPALRLDAPPCQS